MANIINQETPITADNLSSYYEENVRLRIKNELNEQRILQFEKRDQERMHQLEQKNYQLTKDNAILNYRLTHLLEHKENSENNTYVRKFQNFIDSYDLIE